MKELLLKALLSIYVSSNFPKSTV